MYTKCACLLVIKILHTCALNYLDWFTCISMLFGKPSRANGIDKLFVAMNYEILTSLKLRRCVISR